LTQVTFAGRQCEKNGENLGRKTVRKDCTAATALQQLQLQGSCSASIPPYRQLWQTSFAFLFLEAAAGGAGDGTGDGGGGAADAWAE
jgi:hypothetical protein